MADTRLDTSMPLITEHTPGKRDGTKPALLAVNGNGLSRHGQPVAVYKKVCVTDTDLSTFVVG